MLPLCANTTLDIRNKSKKKHFLVHIFFGKTETNKWAKLIQAAQNKNYITQIFKLQTMS